MTTFLRDLGLTAAAVTAIVGCVVLVARLRPVRWVWRTIVSDPLSRWFRCQIAHEVEPRTALLYAQLGQVEATVTTNSGRIAEIEKQLATNGGDTLRDKVDGLVMEVAEVRTEQAAASDRAT